MSGLDGEVAVGQLRGPAGSVWLIAYRPDEIGWVVVARRQRDGEETRLVCVLTAAIARAMAVGFVGGNDAWIPAESPGYPEGGPR